MDQLIREAEDMLAAPEIVKDPNAVLGALNKTRLALYKLFDAEDFDWEQPYYDKRPEWKELKERMEERKKILQRQSDERLPTALPKTTPKRKNPIMRIETDLHFHSLQEFLRAIDDVRLLMWNHYRTLSPKLIKQHVARFIGFFASVTEESLRTLPGSELERDRALDQYQRWAGITNDIVQGSHQDWLNFAEAIGNSLNFDSEITPRTSEPTDTPPQE